MLDAMVVTFLQEVMYTIVVCGLKTRLKSHGIKLV